LNRSVTIIGPARIRPGCHICERCHQSITRSFLNTRIGAGVRLRKIGVRATIAVDRNGNHFDLQEAAPVWLHHRCARQDVAQPSPIIEALAELLGTISASARRVEATALNWSTPALGQNHRGFALSAFTAIRCTLGDRFDRFATCSAAIVDPLRQPDSSARARRSIKA